MLPYLAATTIGSFPESDPKETCRKILDNLPELPLWPQLPQRDFHEGMYIQYAGGFPGLCINEEKKRIHFDLGEPGEELEAFFQKYLENDLASFAVDEGFASGLYCFASMKDAVKAGKPRWIKGHVTGPVSFGLTVTDKDRKPLLYDPQLKEIILIGLRMKALWQIEFLKKIHDRILFFIDEPYLASIGSGIISLKPDEVVADLKEFIDVLKAAGVLTGIHCCGNTDWSLLMKAGVEVLSFDAFNYGDSILLYEKDFREFMGRGGCLAWGIVPTMADTESYSLEKLAERMEGLIELYTARGFNRDELLAHSFITPSCGTSSLTVAQSDSVLHRTAALSRLLRERYSVEVRQ